MCCLALAAAVLAAVQNTTNSLAESPLKLGSPPGQPQEIVGLAGTRISASIPLQSTDVVFHLSIRIEPADKDFSTSVFPASLERVGPGRTIAVDVEGNPTFAHSGSSTKELVITGCWADLERCPPQQTVKARLPLQWLITSPNSENLPPNLSEPTRDRIVQDEGGPLASDEVFVLAEDAFRGHPDNLEALAFRLAETYDGVLLGGNRRAGVIQLAFPDSETTDLEARLKEIEREPGVRTAVHHWISKPYPDIVPDEYSAAAWESGPPSERGWNLQLVEADAAWHRKTTAEGVDVAVIDWEINLAHRELVGSAASSTMWSSPGKRDNADGHGTSVGGIACATGNNGFGISGVAWNCSLHALNLGDREIYAALERAISSEPDVVNLSLGFVEDCRFEYNGQELRAAHEMGRVLEQVLRDTPEILWVWAAGNECNDVRKADPTKAYVLSHIPNALSVAAVNSDGSLADYSSFGDLVHVAAPGGMDIHSGLGIEAPYPYRSCRKFLVFGGHCEDLDGMRSDFGGTSAAAPHVSGIAALVKAVNPELDGVGLKECVVNGAAMGGQKVSVAGGAIPGYESRAAPDDVRDLYIVNAASSVDCEPGRFLSLAYDLPLERLHDGEACGRPPNNPFVPQDARCVSVIDVDLDGDDWRDRLILYARERRHGPDRGTAKAILATSRVSKLDLGPLPSDLNTPLLFEVADLDGDDGDEVVTISSRGAAAYALNLLTLDGEVLTNVDHPLGVGSAVAHGHGYRCADTFGDEDPELIDVGWIANSENGGWNWYESHHEWIDKRLELVHELSGFMDVEPSDSRTRGFTWGGCKDHLPTREPLPPQATSPEGAIEGLLDTYSNGNADAARAYAGVGQATVEDPVAKVFGSKLDLSAFTLEECEVYPFRARGTSQRNNAFYCVLLSTSRKELHMFVEQTSRGSWFVVTEVILPNELFYD